MSTVQLFLLHVFNFAARCPFWRKSVITPKIFSQPTLPEEEGILSTWFFGGEWNMFYLILPFLDSFSLLVCSDVSHCREGGVWCDLSSSWGVFWCSGNGFEKVQTLGGNLSILMLWIWPAPPHALCAGSKHVWSCSLCVYWSVEVKSFTFMLDVWEGCSFLEQRGLQ